MNKKVLNSVAFGFAAIVFLSFKTTYTVQETWKAPAEADTLKSPFAFTPQVIREGEKLFAAYCVSCHGPKGLGDGSPGKFTPAPANFHSKRVIDQTDGALFWKLSNGRGIFMPSYKAIFTDEQRWQLIAYIRQFPKRGSAENPNLVKDISNYRIDVKFPGNYFPIPKKVTNVNRSEAQYYMVDTVVQGLTRPWSMVFLPGNRLLVAQRDGKLVQVTAGKPDGVIGNTLKGLRDIKIHPDFEKNKLIYLSYYIDPLTRGAAGQVRLVRAKLEGKALVDTMTIYQAGPFRGNGEWYGNKIAFDHKGFLYFTIPIKSARTNAQDLSKPDGKTMRLKDDGSIPSDNPFVNTPNALPEIYSYGHRVHEGLAIDPKTGRIFSTEFGELGGDELNELKPGTNYGWPIVSFSLEYSGAVISKSPFKEGMEPPLHHFAVAPGDLAILDGDRYPNWKGDIFISGLAAKLIHRAVFKNKVFSHDERILENIGRVRDVKVGPDKFLYALTEDNGLVVRILPVKR
jgi:glucose/arabinose dehydrogenase/mono/diheme cytochrome c family protein